MPGERVSMRKIRDVLRLRFGHRLPQRTIGQSLRLSQGAVSEYLKRAQRAGLAWPLPDDLEDDGLEVLLFPPPTDVPTDHRPVPDWSAIHRETRRPNVTLALLWEEYRDETVDGFGYSWFCDLYRAWVGRLKPTLRQVHTAGEKLFVDFAGHTMEVVDGATGARFLAAFKPLIEDPITMIVCGAPAWSGVAPMRGSRSSGACAPPSASWRPGPTFRMWSSTTAWSRRPTSWPPSSRESWRRARPRPLT